MNFAILVSLDDDAQKTTYRFVCVMPRANNDIEESSCDWSRSTNSRAYADILMTDAMNHCLLDH